MSSTLPFGATTIDEVTAEAGLHLPDDVVIEIDQDTTLVGHGIYGYCWPDGSQIMLYPDAFDDVEQLLRTLVHELVHVRQVRENGPTTDSVMLQMREVEAYGEENAWWQSYLERR